MTLPNQGTDSTARTGSIAQQGTPGSGDPERIVDFIEEGEDQDIADIGDGLALSYDVSVTEEEGEDQDQGQGQDQDQGDVEEVDYQV